MRNNTAELEELVDGTVNIPTIPTVLTEVTAICNAADGSARDAAKVIEKDAAIASRALRLVNGSLYGLKSPVANINLACSILGLRVIKNLVVQATVLQAFGDTQSLAGFDADWLWQHAFKTATACRLLAEDAHFAKGLPKDDAYTCGLIHDIGKLILLESSPDRFGQALQQSATRGVPLATAEHELFGFDHAQVGGLLANRWKLAPAVQEAVVNHHARPDDAEAFAQGLLVRMGNSIAHLAVDNSGGYHGDICDAAALAGFGLAPERLQTILAAARAANMAS